MKTARIRMNVSLAGMVGHRDFSAQPGDVVDVPADLAKKWVRSNLAEPAPDAQLSDPDVRLADLTAEEALCRNCESCEQRRATTVLRNRAFCRACYRAHLEL
jgi:hypothetical protein